MSFIWPPLLLFAAAAPLGALLYLRFEERRRARVASFGLGGAVTAGRESHAIDGRPIGRVRRRLPGALLLAGATLLLAALARPQSVVSVPRLEGTVILAFDVSGSMAATDLEPTRMEAAKTAAREFVTRQPASILIGVVAFSDSGFSVQVPTADQALVLGAIDRLAPERGTSLGRGIITSLTTIQEAEEDDAAGFYTNRSPDPTPAPTPVPDGMYSSAAIVLLSDGENTDGSDPIVAAEAAEDRGVRIYTVGIGSPDGATIEVEGFQVHSRLDEAALERIAEVTGGAYFAAEDPEDLAAVYERVETRLVVRPEEMEITSLVAGAGALILLVGAVSSLLWLGRLP
jgi:Ca-activated chloride channel homolog